MATVPNLPFSGAQLHSLLVQFADEISGASGSVTWANLSGKPTSFPPAPHTHDIADVTGLQAALDAKTARIFDTDAEAEAYAAANPGAVVFSREGV